MTAAIARAVEGRLAGGLAALCVLLALTSGARADALPLQGIHKIQHVVMIMQENRSFDSYFGTFPGADGIPAGVCVPDPLRRTCDAPYHDPADVNYGGPHGNGSARIDVDGGKMDGFVAAVEPATKCTSSTDPNCNLCERTPSEAQEPCQDVMGYHDAREIPNYWTYAKNFVLQDHMFESVASWSAPSHDYVVSGWSGIAPAGDPNPMDCVNDANGSGTLTNSWTDVTYLLSRQKVSWRYYVFKGSEPDCESDEAITCSPVKQGPRTPGIWNPLAGFTDVKEDNQLENIQSLDKFYTAVHEPSVCALPNVTWIDPNGTVSEHPPSRISRGQAYVTTLINAIMRSPCWESTAIFISWDDWGGFYDHVVPPTIDRNGYGLRVPGLVISPYAKTGYVDHQQLSHDTYLKFIEDDFLEGARLNPATDGRPDKRPDVREEAPGLGDLSNDFNFEQVPRAPLLLSPEPPPGPASTPPGQAKPPLVETGPFSQVTQASATVSGSVNPNESAVSSCSFEYGTSTAYGSIVPCGSLPGGGAGAVEASAPLSGLSANRTYHVRLVASNEGGHSVGADGTFVTPPEPPTVQSGAASNVSQTSATVSASVNPNESAVSSCSFEYGTSSAFGSSVPCASLPGGGASPVEVSAALSGLTANRTYRYRVVAGSEGGRSVGAEGTFSTPPEPPLVETGTASQVSQTSATVSASVNPNESVVSSCSFEYGTSSAFGSSVPCASLPGGGASAVEVSAALSGLTANRTYRYRVVAGSEGGRSVGAEGTFSTPPEPPLVETGTASQATQTSATVGGSVNPNESPLASCFFEYGSSVFYEASAPCGSLPAPGSNPVEVSSLLEGLAASTTYHFHLLAANAGGQSVGADRTFTTLPERPAVSAVAPASGPEAGGASVTISGANLSGASAVMFGSSRAASFAVDSPSAITATTPPGRGTVDVEVTTTGGASAAIAADSFAYLAVPTITQLSPAKGPVEGGTAVTVSGSGLVPGETTVSFGGVAAASVTVRSATALAAVSPAERAGAVDARVTTPGGTSAVTTADRFKFIPTISGISPSTGPAAGGTSVEVTGSGFAAGSKGTTITFGTTKATSVNCTSSTECTARSPAGAGVVDVRAIVKSVGSAKTPSDQFTYF